MGTRLLDRRLRSAAAPLILLCLAAPAFAQTGAIAASQPITPAKPIPLFNGKNLDGWYVWLKSTGREDPKKVFSVSGDVLRISGEDWGGIATRQEYRDYHLVVEWRWGGPTWGDRKTKARDSGILVHATGRDGAHGGIWLESIESQIIEGGSGDYILVGGDTKPSMTAVVRTDEKGQTYWFWGGGTPRRRDSGRFNWFNRHPAWTDTIDFRGPNDVEHPVGTWNRQEVICDGGRITTILNGIVVNEGYDATPTAGKIQIQSEGAEILIRRIDLLPLSRKR